MGLLFEELGLLNVANLICNFLVLWGIAISTGIPAILAILLIKGQTEDGDIITAVILIVVFLCLMVSSMIYEILTESVGCIFIFYAMDKRFFHIGLIQEFRLQNEIHTKFDNNYAANPYGPQAS